MNDYVNIIIIIIICYNNEYRVLNIGDRACIYISKWTLTKWIRFGPMIA